MGVKKRCEGCSKNLAEPPILAENAMAVKVFRLCRRQWRTGWTGAYALDGNFVWSVLNDLNLTNKTETYCRVDSLAALYLEAIKKK